jgi:hypothetical protein
LWTFGIGRFHTHLPDPTSNRDAGCNELLPYAAQALQEPGTLAPTPLRCRRACVPFHLVKLTPCPAPTDSPDSVGANKSRDRLWVERYVAPGTVPGAVATALAWGRSDRPRARDDGVERRGRGADGAGAAPRPHRSTGSSCASGVVRSGIAAPADGRMAARSDCAQLEPWLVGGAAPGMSGKLVTACEGSAQALAWSRGSLVARRQRPRPRRPIRCARSVGRRQNVSEEPLGATGDPTNGFSCIISRVAANVCA